MKKKTGVNRLIYTLVYSKQGLIQAFKCEEAFRQEVLLFTFMLPVAILLEIPIIEKIMLISVLFVVLITELLNSAIEAVVDRVGKENHELSGRAKDMGSAAVLISLVLMVGVWGSLLLK